MLKKKIRANFQRIVEVFPKKCSICYRFGIRDPRSGIRKKPIPDPGSRGQKGTGSRIRNTAHHFNTDPDPKLSLYCGSGFSIECRSGSSLVQICEHWYAYPPGLHYEHLKLRKVDFNADPDPAFHNNSDPDPASKNNPDPCAFG
jgi:hypothetical protein